MSKSKNIPIHYRDSDYSKEGSRGAVISVRKIGAIAVTAGALAGLIISNEHQNRPPDQVDDNEPYRVATAKPGNTEWGMAVKAFPNLRPEVAAEFFDDQNPNENHLVTPGQKFILPADARIGKLVDPSGDAG